MNILDSLEKEIVDKNSLQRRKRGEFRLWKKDY